MAEVDLWIAGRSYRVGCRDGEEDALRRAAEMVDGKSREALAGLGALSEARQLLFAALLLADQLLEPGGHTSATEPSPDPALAERAETLARRLESLAGTLEQSAR